MKAGVEPMNMNRNREEPAVDFYSNQNLLYPPDEDRRNDVDPSIYDLGRQVRIDFDEIYTEPESCKHTALGRTLGEKVLHVAYRALYTYVQAAVYYILSVIVGAVSSLVFGIIFGANSVVLVWIVHPTLKLFFTWLRVFGLAWRSSVRTFLDPPIQSFAVALSFIRARFVLNLSGMKSAMRQVEAAEAGGLEYM